MHNNDSDHPDTISKPDGKHLPGFNSDNSDDRAPQERRREPVFSGFDEEDNYEEPDRDTDSTSSYHEENLEDEEFDELPQDADDFNPQAETEWDEPEQTSTHYALTSEEGEEEEDSDEWDDEEDYFEEDDENYQKFPLGLIVVAIIALLLLAAGGYGVIQQRSATQEEIRELQATLATAASPAEVTASRDAMRKTQGRNTELLAAVDALTLENRRLAETVAGLESQLAAQQDALDKQAVASKPAPVAVTAPPPVKATPKPAAPKTAAPVAAGGGAWFVNFSSYDQRTTAESWATKLKPGVGKVVVTTGNKEGATVYRVRVIGLASRESAEEIARQLESEYGLPKLWVGRQ